MTRDHWFGLAAFFAGSAIHEAVMLTFGRPPSAIGVLLSLLTAAMFGWRASTTPARPE